MAAGGRTRDDGIVGKVWAGAAAIAGLLLTGWAANRLRPRTLEIHPRAAIAVWDRNGGRDAVTLPGRFLVAEVSRYDDELYGRLMFQYLRGAAAFRGSEVLMTYRKENGALTYPIQVYVGNDLLSAIPLLAGARRRGLIGDYEWRWVNEEVLLDLRYQDHVFETAYNLSGKFRLEEMSRAQLVRYLKRFVRYKSAVDPRVRKAIEPAPRPLTDTEAHRFAEDIVTVAEFYSLPLDFFLGIGAMENNYMNVKGDLDNAVWKRRAEKGDMVLRRRGGRVLVLNPSSGVWQITRETLRYVHRLYLKDRRDYSRLPGHLRPPRELNLDEPDAESLTTYAGLLFRDLLDRFHGDVAAAVGAYNGGPGNPNARYEAGVRAVAEHARTVLERAAALHGRPAAGMQFLRGSQITGGGLR